METDRDKLDDPVPYPTALPAEVTPPAWWCAGAVLYPGCYSLYVLLSALDVVLTWHVLHLEGQELNVLADWVIARWDLRGVVIFKFVLVTMVICICEAVGRRNDRVGRVLAAIAAGITAIPVGLTAMQLAIEYAR